MRAIIRHTFGRGPIRVSVRYRRRSTATASVLICGLAAMASPLALTDEEIYAALRLAAPSPGARAAAMGGASLALVEGPAAASVNPARLALEDHRSVLLEARGGDGDRASLGDGSVAFDPSINPFAGSSLAGEGSGDPRTAPGFLGYAHPLEGAWPVTLAASRTSLLATSLDARTSNTTVPLSAPVAPSGGDEVLRISEGALDVDVAAWDLAAAWRVTCSFAVGGG